VACVAEEGMTICEECGEFSELFMVEDSLWMSVAKRLEIICLPCFESRLGRRVIVDDLRRMPNGGETPCNDWLIKERA
jgi:hypothetical protein